MNQVKTSLMWFRQDLRTLDNLALAHSCQAQQCLAIYILDEKNSGAYQAGSASKLWLHQSLHHLNDCLNGKLMCYRGDPQNIIEQLIKQYDICAVYWNRCYEPWAIKRDRKIKRFLLNHAILCQSFNGSLLWEPWTILKKDGRPYQVFTPYYQKGCMKAGMPRAPIHSPDLPELMNDKKDAQAIDQLDLVDAHAYSRQLLTHVLAGQSNAQQALERFIKQSMVGYKTARDFPEKRATSGLSPHLHFGEISPHQVWHQIHKKVAPNPDRDHFLSEIAWREFSYYLLYHIPNLPLDNLQPKFNHFPWRENACYLKAWQKGLTGYPVVDAGMRELWQTGWMHNRLRMIVASFLVKNLGIHWHQGERWFWDCLFDADLASNSASWQWVAGCGADAAPYFRIFNPIIQGKKFDPEGGYVRRFIPELAKLPHRYLFEPWLAPPSILKQAQVILGVTYPYPIIDLQQSRAQALANFSKLKALE